MPDDVAGELADRLRSKGVAFRPADLEAFAAGLPRRPEAGSDVDALVGQFMEESRAYVLQARKRKQAWSTIDAGLLLVVIGLLVLVFVAAVMTAQDRRDGSPGIFCGVVFCLIGLAAAAHGVATVVRTRRESADGRPPFLREGFRKGARADGE